MKQWILAGMVLFLMGLSACSSSQPVCNSPYIAVGQGCCLDVNDNNICDSDESEDVAGTDDDGTGAAVAEDENRNTTGFFDVKTKHCFQYVEEDDDWYVIPGVTCETKQDCINIGLVMRVREAQTEVGRTFSAEELEYVKAQILEVYDPENNVGCASGTKIIEPVE